ncbi:MAG: hypothetical protein Q9191_006359 [Dirinaria sp. TL-2023a]
MAPQVFIDLSLSTDDEGPARTLKSTTEANVGLVQSHDDFVFLSDESFKENPPKRRKTGCQISSNRDRAITSSTLEVSIQERPLQEANLQTTNKLRRTEPTSFASDDIVFTSSADVNHSSRFAPNTQLVSVNPDDSDASLPEDILATARSTNEPTVSVRTTALLAKLQETRPPLRKPSNAQKFSTADSRLPKKSRSPNSGLDDNLEHTDSESHPRSRRQASTNTKLSDEQKALKAREREEARVARRAERAEEKEKERDKRRAEREEKAREKQRAADLTEVNKAKKDKKETSKEMIVDLPMSIEGSRIDDQIKEYMKNLGIETNTYQSQVPNTIRWRRKVNSYFDEEKAYRVTIPKEVHNEKHVLCLLSAKEFVQLATAVDTQSESETSEEHVRTLRRSFQDCKPIYLIEGLDAWMKKNRTIRNREYQAAVLGQAQIQDNTAPSASQQAGRRKKPVEKYVDEDLIEDVLLRLQVSHGCLIHHTSSPFGTAEWVVNFTQHISQEKMQMETTFCMESGQVKTGEDKDDTYVKMLQEVARITLSMANGIAMRYPNVGSLVQGLVDHGPLALEDIKVINPLVSRA